MVPNRVVFVRRKAGLRKKAAEKAAGPRVPPKPFPRPSQRAAIQSRHVARCPVEVIRGLCIRVPSLTLIARVREAVVSPTSFNSSREGAPGQQDSILIINHTLPPRKKKKQLGTTTFHYFSSMVGSQIAFVENMSVLLNLCVEI